MKKLYFMDDHREAKRLDSKVNADEFIDDFLFSHIKNEKGFHILDAGCGAGMIASSIAKRFEKTTVTGLDISEQRIAKAKEKVVELSNVDFTVGSIYDIPIEDESKDLIYTRFLLEYLKEPFQAIQELRRICKKGGTVVLQDLDAQLVSHFPQDILYLNEMLEGLAETGFDPYIGRKLYNFGRLAGFTDIDTDIRIYHKIVGKINDTNYKLWDLKLDIAMEKFTEILGEQKAQVLKNTFMNFLLDEDSIMYSNLFTVYLRKTD